MYEYRCIIKRVVDGDTVDVDIDLGFDTWIHNERVRLMAFDAPESRTRDPVEKAFGLYAKQYVEKHLPVGSVCLLKTFKDDYGKYGRVLGDFFINDGEVSLVQKMIKENVGVKYDKKEIMEKQHLENRKILIEKKLVKIEE